VDSARYILNLQKVILDKDIKVQPSHISLYMALYILSNANEFKAIKASRAQLKRCSRIASNATFHGCIRDLQSWRLIRYYPSFDPSVQSIFILNELP
jgi:hypothetical protein